MKEKFKKLIHKFDGMVSELILKAAANNRLARQVEPVTEYGKSLAENRIERRKICILYYQLKDLLQ